VTTRRRTSTSTPDASGVQAARFSIDSGDLIDGTLPAAKLAAATSWCRRHREALSADWGRAQLDLHPTGRYDSS
jgi:hypothetical protein